MKCSINTYLWVKFETDPHGLIQHCTNILGFSWKFSVLWVTSLVELLYGSFLSLLKNFTFVGYVFLELGSRYVLFISLINCCFFWLKNHVDGVRFWSQNTSKMWFIFIFMYTATVKLSLNILFSKWLTFRKMFETDEIIFSLTAKSFLHTIMCLQYLPPDVSHFAFNIM